ncbi:hypothetical protein AOLI_G00005110 [Acnodon oligacanthus]
MERQKSLLHQPDPVCLKLWQASLAGVNPAAMSWQEDQPPLSLSRVLCSCRMNSAHSIVSPVPGRGGRQASKNAQSTHR